MTFSIIARCPRTGYLGVGSTTFSIACGRRNESVRANVGICKSQAFYLRRADPLALNLLALGHAPEHVLRVLAADDPDFDYRQFALVDRHGEVVAHTGANVGPWAGHTIGAGYAAFGNGLAGPQTVAGIVAGFAKDPDAPLQWRLLAALEGGRDAGGQAKDARPWPERSAWIRVVGEPDQPGIDLRVDLHDRTLAHMRTLMHEYERRESYYRERSRDPAAAVAEERLAHAGSGDTAG